MFVPVTDGNNCRPDSQCESRGEIDWVCPKGKVASASPRVEGIQRFPSLRIRVTVTLVRLESLIRRRWQCWDVGNPKFVDPRLQVLNLAYDTADGRAHLPFERRQYLGGLQLNIGPLKCPHLLYGVQHQLAEPARYMFSFTRIRNHDA